VAGDLDQQQADQRAAAGELDYIEAPSQEPAPAGEGPTSNVKLVDWNPLGNQYTFRPITCIRRSTTRRSGQALWYCVQPERTSSTR
jgi:peptide/nickel transport system substrate-binding protein